MPYVPPAKLSTLADVGLVLPSLNDILEYGSRTAGKWTNEPAAAGTTLGLANNPQLTGAVTLAPGSNINARQVGQQIILGAPAQAARTASVFFPGVLSAKTGAVMIVNAPNLSQVDAYFVTAAPAGVSGAACANLVIQGESAGNYTLPLSTPGQAEWHSGFLGQIVFEQTILNAGAMGSDAGSFGFNFTPTANLTVESLILSFMNQNAVRGVDPPAGSFIRVGFIPGQTTDGSQASYANLAALNALWITDSVGAPAYVDFDTSQAGSLNQAVLNTLQFANPVNLVNGTKYAVIMQLINNAKTAMISTNNFGIGGSTSNTTGSNFVGSANYTDNDAFIINFGHLPPSPWVLYGSVSSGHRVFPFFQMGGTGQGTALSGPVQVAITMTGAPATPGTDLNVVLQF